MTTLQKETEPKAADTKHSTVAPQTLTELLEESFRTFCDDISGMFSLNIKCDRLQPVVVETLEDLKKHLKEPVSVHCVKAEGALESTFHLVLDRDGLFTLAGIVSMHAEQMILEDIKFGSLEKARDMSSILTEVGEAIVGAWDRVFHKGLAGHNNFAQMSVLSVICGVNPKKQTCQTAKK